MPLTEDAAERARRVRLILVDVDGVLTDGRLHFQAELDEAKSFDARDGVGMRLAQRAGLLTGIITGRLSLATTRRARELGLDEVHQRVFGKLEVFESILKSRRLPEQSVCFMGDDLVDVPVMRRAGLAAAPADARPEARRAAHFVSPSPGGRGAVRDLIDFILKVQGRWTRVTGRYQ